jgi:outer membrane protein OmpA-like peptidoglycan-associated protein
MIPEPNRTGLTPMRYFFALTAFLTVAASSPAAAQMYPGEEVTVNPGAVGTQVLRYPGSNTMRIVPPLRQPGEATGPARLHTPARYRLARTGHAPATAAAPEAPVARVVQPAPRTADLSDFGNVAVARPANPVPQAPPAKIEPKFKPEPVRTPPPQRVARIEPPPARTLPPQRVARTEPPPARTLPPARNPEADSGSKRGVVLFAPDATDPSVSALQSVKSLAGDLSATLAEGSSRVQLLAFGGPQGEKSSNTRRLSLKRALVIRQILIDNGVPSERIDVRAMGGTDDSGPLDRVDVFLKS